MCKNINICLWYSRIKNKQNEKSSEIDSLYDPVLVYFGYYAMEQSELSSCQRYDTDISYDWQRFSIISTNW